MSGRNGKSAVDGGVNSLVVVVIDVDLEVSERPVPLVEDCCCLECWERRSNERSVAACWVNASKNNWFSAR